MNSNFMLKMLRSEATAGDIAWIPLVSVFCGSGAVSGIQGKQMTPAVASERSIFSKNHDYNIYKFFVSRRTRTYVYFGI